MKPRGGKRSNPYSGLLKRGLISGSPLYQKEQEAAKSQAAIDAQKRLEEKIKSGNFTSKTKNLEGGDDILYTATAPGKAYSSDLTERAKQEQYWIDNPDKKKEYDASKHVEKLIKTEGNTSSNIKKVEEKPEVDYSYLDGAQFKQGYTKPNSTGGGSTTYGMQILSNTGAGDSRDDASDRGDDAVDPMSRYLTQDELDYLTRSGVQSFSAGSKSQPMSFSSGYDAMYEGKKGKGSFIKAVDQGLIDEEGHTIPLYKPEEGKGNFNTNEIEDIKKVIGGTNSMNIK